MKDETQKAYNNFLALMPRLKVKKKIKKKKRKKNKKRKTDVSGFWRELGMKTEIRPEDGLTCTKKKERGKKWEKETKKGVKNEKKKERKMSK